MGNHWSKIILHFQWRNCIHFVCRFAGKNGKLNGCGTNLLGVLPTFWRDQLASLCPLNFRHNFALVLDFLDQNSYSGCYWLAGKFMLLYFRQSSARFSVFNVLFSGSFIFFSFSGKVQFQNLCCNGGDWVFYTRTRIFHHKSNVEKNEQDKVSGSQMGVEKEEG